MSVTALAANEESITVTLYSDVGIKVTLPNTDTLDNFATMTRSRVLAPGESWTEDILDSGTATKNYANLADFIAIAPGETISLRARALTNSRIDATGAYDGNARAYATSHLEVTYTYDSSPAVEVKKFTNTIDAPTAPGPYIDVGDPVTWTYEVKNTGNVILHDIEVTDDKLNPHMVGTIATLAAGATAPLITAPVGTASIGQYENTGTATGLDPNNAPVSDSYLSHYFGQAASISLVKKTNGLDAPLAPGPYVPVGDPVTWTYEVTNTGNVELTNVEVTDDKLPGFLETIPSLAPLASHTFTAPASTSSIGQYENTGTAKGTPSVGSDVSASYLSHYFGSDPGISLVKKTNGIDAPLAPGPYVSSGNPVTWTYEVTNTGNVELHNIEVTDDKLDPHLVGTIATLAVGATAPLITAPVGTATIGQYENTGTATGLDPNNAPISASYLSHYFGQTPAVSIKKYTNGVDAPLAPGPYIDEGDPVAWTYEVTNTGNVVLHDVQVTDDRLTPHLVGTIATLAVGATAPLITAPVGVATIGQYENTGTATGLDPNNAPVSGSYLSHYFGQTPAVSIKKRTNEVDAPTAPGPYINVGNPVTWTYEVTNTGNVELHDIEVTDDKLDPHLVGTIATLAPGATAPLITAPFGAANIGQYENTGTPTGLVLCNESFKFYGLSYEKDHGKKETAQC